MKLQLTLHHRTFCVVFAISVPCRQPNFVEKHSARPSKQCTTHMFYCQERGGVLHISGPQFRGNQKSISVHTPSILFKHTLAALAKWPTSWFLLLKVSKFNKFNFLRFDFASESSLLGQWFMGFMGLHGVHPDWPAKGKITHSTRAW